ncbi:MAG: AMP-binding protein [Candidatus Omnitrophica bacterium]|nr:AMP-binding protein [Candidatus Omnitrophota bacterium]
MHKKFKDITYEIFYWFLRGIVCFFLNVFYRLTIINKPELDEKKPALFVPNHVTYLDALLIMSLTKRKVRFIVDKRIYNIFALKPFLKTLKVIPISGKDNPKEIARSLKKIKQALKEGDIVVFFAEGEVTRTGNTLGFKRGFEHVVKNSSIPVYPIYLHGIWGSLFSFSPKKTFFKKPKTFKQKINIVFGDIMLHPVTAFDLRCKMLELGAQAMEYRLKRKRTLSEEMFRKAKRKPFKFSMGDSNGKKMNRAQTFIGAYVLSLKLKPLLLGQKYVGIMLPCSIAGALATIALAILDKVSVNLNYTSTDAIIKECMDISDVKITICSRKFLDKINKEIPGKVVLLEDIVTNIFFKDKLFASFIFYFLPASIAEKIIFGKKKRDINEEMAIIFTSGSTGFPKGVMLTHKNILAECQGLYRIINSEEHILMGILPFFHSFGYTTTIWLPMIKGMKVVFHSNPLDAKVIGKTIKNFAVTLLLATPSFLNMYVQRCEKEDMKSLWLIVTGAEKLNKKVADTCEKKFGIIAMEGYGCSEVSPVVSFSIPDFKNKHIHQKAHKKGKIGMTIPGVAISIRDVETGKILGVGKNGLLYVKGPTVMKGYLKRPDLTEEVIKDGWYCTKDIANLDQDGFLEITDRISRFSKIGGEMVPHICIEDKIHEIINADTQGCIVTAVSDMKKGEKIVVLYTIDIDPVYIVHKLMEKNIPNLWIPLAENFYKIEQIPVLGTGKIDLVQVKKIACELSGVVSNI